MALWDLRLTDLTINIKLSADTINSTIRSSRKATNDVMLQAIK